jgi:hypothetical protein
MTHTESTPTALPTLTLRPGSDGRFRVFEANAIFTWPNNGQRMRLVTVYDFGTDGVRVRAIPQRKAGGDFLNHRGTWLPVDVLPDGWNAAVLDAMAAWLPAPQGEQCGAGAHGISYVCTLPVGHNGDLHVAHRMVDGQVVHTWKREQPAPLGSLTAEFDDMPASEVVAPVDFTPAPDASQVPRGDGPTVSPYPCPASGSPLYCECDGRDICKGVPVEQAQPTPFDERALAESDAIIDMTGMAVTSTAAVLAIRAAVQYRADQAQARYLAAQHGDYAVGRGRAMVARDTWREALALVDTVIAERMS